VLAFAAGCGSSSTPAGTLADYASGRWSCRLPVPGAPGGVLKPTAVVTATSATSGRVELDLPWLADLSNGMPGGEIPSKFGGRWALRSSELVVTWDDKSLGTLQAQPIALDTKQFKTRSGVAASHPKWSQVSVHRQARSVSFDFTLVPGAGPRAQLTCTKA
jgi:hypothetical protein